VLCFVKRFHERMGPSKPPFCSAPPLFSQLPPSAQNNKKMDLQVESCVLVTYKELKDTTLPSLMHFHFMRSGRPPFSSKLWGWATWNMANCPTLHYPRDNSWHR
jgi:hypothetical protein